MSKFLSQFTLAVLLGLLVVSSTWAIVPVCGVSPSDWCVAPGDDPCAIHKDKSSCQADKNCEGMPYRGESAVACQFDNRGFASNCPTVGCISTCVSMSKDMCQHHFDRCQLDGSTCAPKTAK